MFSQLTFKRQETATVAIVHSPSWALVNCHWWKLTQVSFLSQQNILLSWQDYFCYDKSMRVVTKLLSWQDYFCYDKSMLVVTKLLSWQDYFCYDKSMLVVTKLLSWQDYFCYDKSMRVVTKLLSWQDYFCYDKSMLVVTKLLSWQDYFCYDKSMLVVTKLLSQQHQHNFVATRILLSWQKMCFVATDMFVETNTCHIILSHKLHVSETPPPPP